MEEDFLQWVWGTLSFQFSNLSTTCGKPVLLIHQGRHNNEQGPDFLGAHIRMGELDFHGDVEIHLNSDLWYRHKHHLDRNYNTVVLHVVLESTARPILRQDGTPIPELVLNKRIPENLLWNYHRLQFSQEEIPCRNHVNSEWAEKVGSMARIAGFNRMQGKADTFRLRLTETTNDWEQVLWEELAAALGSPHNQEPMRRLAKAASLRILRKYSDKVFAMESILFGVSGMLYGIPQPDEYSEKLIAEWKFYSGLHSLESLFLPLRFFRMRPGSFPSIRISQLAALLHSFPVLSELLTEKGYDEILKRKISASEYWNTHSNFGEPCKPKAVSIGNGFKNILLINTLVPLSILYGDFSSKTEADERFIHRMKSLPAESNSRTSLFAELGFVAANALESQGLIEMKNHFCSEKRCMQCEVGKAIVRR